MTKIFTWIKEHKLASVFIFAFLLLLTTKYPGGPRPYAMPSSIGRMDVMTEQSGAPNMMAGDAKMGLTMPSFQPPVPPSDRDERIVSKDTSLSLKVDNVQDSLSKIEQTATSFGGYLVDSNVTVPEGAASGSITVRVPSEKRSEALTAMKAVGVKVVSEYVSGQDLTDAYVDNEERLRILETTKTKFEAILADAKNVTEMLSVQRELLSIQQQIDGIKGQQNYLEGSAKLSRISVYLSTDELALPYAPDSAWRPAVVAKEAVRSLIMNTRQLLNALIWIGVYLPVIVVVTAIFYIAGKKLKMY